MPIMRLVLLGTGVSPDDYRPDVPNYTTLGVDAVNGTITISQAARYGPPTLPPPGAPFWVTENGVTILIDLPEEMLTSWWQRLASQYPGRTPPYLPGFP